MQVIAHRGFARDAPENTVEAVRAAATIADAVEVDVRRCGSGELVAFHDERVDRVTDGTGRVADHDLDVLRALEVGGSDECIPPLSAVVAAVPSETPMYLELKETGLAADVLSVLEAYDRRAVLSSFEPPILEEVAAVDPDRPRALIGSRLRDRPVRTAARLGCAGVHLPVGLCLVPGVPRSARSAGLTLNAWTVRRPTVVRLLAWRGVDGVAVDSSETVSARFRDERHQSDP